MRVDYKPEHDVEPAAAREATGRSYEDWFAELDAAGGPPAGRKALGEHLLKRFKLDPWWVTTVLVEYERARGVVEKDGAARGYSICVTKSLAASPAQAFELLARSAWWLGAAKLEEGGVFDDGEGHSGRFKKVTPGKVVRFSWEGARHQPGETVEIKLTAAGAKTSVVLTHDRLPDRAAADGMRAAWSAMLEEWKSRVS